MVANVAPVAGENSPAPTPVGSASEAIDCYAITNRTEEI